MEYYDFFTEKTLDEKLSLFNIDKKNKKIIKDIYLRKKFGNDVLNEIIYFTIEELNKSLKYVDENDDKEITSLYIQQNITHVKYYENLYKINMESVLQEEVSDSVYKCSKCQSKNVTTLTKRVRSADEPDTDFNTCNNCGKKWSIN
jgi:transcription elongation factor S-II